MTVDFTRQRSDLARDLRWLAAQWRAADRVMRLRIQQAFKRGLDGRRFKGEANL